MNKIIYTKSELQEMIDEYVEYMAKLGIYAERTQLNAKFTLNGFTKKYTVDLSFAENVYNYLKDIPTKPNYDTARSILKRFCSYSNIIVDWKEYSFIPTFITFEDINIGLTQTARESNFANDSMLCSHYIFLRLYVYLLWLGLKQSEMAALIKKDYDVQNKVLNVSGLKIDLSSAYYADCSKFICDELVENIKSVTARINGILSYVSTRSAPNLDIQLFGVERGKTYAAIATLRRCNTLCKKYLYDNSIIENSGNMFRLRKWEQLHGRAIDRKNIKTAIKETNVQKSDKIAYENYMLYRRCRRT